jgi:histone deacetylase 1/2
MDNANSFEYLEKIKTQVIENLKRTAFAPSVQMTDVPRDPEGYDDEADAILDDLDEDENKDARDTPRRWEKRTTKDEDLSESDDEEQAAANGIRKQPGRRRRRNIMDFSNPAAPQYPEDSAVLSPHRSSSQHGRAEASNGDGTNGAEEASLDSPNAQSPGAEDVEMDDETPAEMEAPAETEAQAAPTRVTPPESPSNQQNATTGAPPTPPSQPKVEEDTEMTEDDPKAAKSEGAGQLDQENVEAEAKAEEKATEEQ